MDNPSERGEVGLCSFWKILGSSKSKVMVTTLPWARCSGLSTYLQQPFPIPPSVLPALMIRDGQGCPEVSLALHCPKLTVLVLFPNHTSKC